MPRGDAAQASLALPVVTGLTQRSVASRRRRHGRAGARSLAGYRSRSTVTAAWSLTGSRCTSARRPATCCGREAVGEHVVELHARPHDRVRALARRAASSR